MKVGASLVPRVPRGIMQFVGCAARGGVVIWRLISPAVSMQEVNGVRRIITSGQAWWAPGYGLRVEATVRGFVRRVALWGRFLRQFRRVD